MYKFGFIGVGNMGGALAKAICEKENSVIISDKNNELAKSKAKEFGCTCGDCETVLKNAKYIFLGVKPQVLPEVLNQLKFFLSERKDDFVIITMAAGTKMSVITDALGKVPVIRIMPNTPVSIGEGTTVYCVNEYVSQSDKENFVSAMENSGIIIEIDEKFIDAASAISGCGPAFVYMFAEALADGGVQCGLSRELAITLAANTIKGAGDMILKTGKNPAQLKNDVCSPGGTTIEGVYALEKGKMRFAVMDAVNKAYLKNERIK